MAESAQVGGSRGSPVSRFIRNLEADRTREIYTTYLKGFFGYLRDGTVRRPRSSNGPELLAALDVQAVPYLAEMREGKRYAADDLEDFIAAAKREGYSPYSVNGMKAAAVGFFEANRIELSRLDERRVKKLLPRNRTVSEETTIRMDHLRTLLPLMNVRDRALTLVLLSSGGRIGEVLALRLKDIDLDATPARLSLRAETTKTKEDRIAFISPEAVDALRAWIAVREGYIKAAAAKVKGLAEAGYGHQKRLVDDRLFPFEGTAYRMGLRSALERAGLAGRCERTGRFLIHPHGLRKYFRTHFGAAAGVDVAEVLMGHRGYLSDAYVRLTDDDLARAYEQHCHVISVSGGGGDVSRQLSEYRAENEALKDRIAKLETDMQIAREVRAYLQEREQGPAH